MISRALKTPKNIKERSRNRRHNLEKINNELKDALKYSTEGINDETELNFNGRASSALNRSIENIFMEKSFDSSMFAAKSLLNINTEVTTDSRTSSTLTAQPDSSIFEIFKTINNGNEIMSRQKTNGLVMRDIFSLENRSVDLELHDDFMKWQLIGAGKQSRIHNSQVYLDKIFAIEPKPVSQKHSNVRRSSTSKGSESHFTKTEGLYETDGFIIHTFVKVKCNSYEQKQIVFEHPHRLTCNQWIKKLQDKLTKKTLNREVLIFLNPHSGEKKSRSIFNFQIQPILKLAKIMYTIVEFHDQKPLQHSFHENNLQNRKFYGIIVLGGDGSVSSIINSIIEAEAKKEENMYISDIGQLSKKLRTPLCLIPTGTTNQIANSIYGTSNVITPLMYLLYNIKMKVDICSAFTSKNKLHSFGFTYSCGFSTTLLRYMKRYNKLGMNKVQSSIAKGASKSKQRTLEVIIEYLLGEGDQPCDKNLCFKNCKVCAESNKFYNPMKSERQTDYQQHEFNDILNTIEDIRQPKKAIEKQKKGEEWKKIHGSFIYIALLSNSSKWSHIAPGGLSKYAHLADGFIDVILVEPTSRKEFYRFLKRHANNKDQLDFPFVRSFRVKEIKIKVLNVSDSKNEADLSDSESIFFSSKCENDEPADELMSSRNLSRRKSNARSELEIENYASECEEDFEVRNSHEINANRESYENYLKIFNTGGTTEELSTVKKLFAEDNMLNINRFSIQNQNVLEQKSKTNFTSKKSKSIMNLFKGEASSKSNVNNQLNSPSILNCNPDEHDRFGSKSFISQSTYFNQDKALKADNVWNCDWNPSEITEMRLKCNTKFLKFFADGIDPDTQYENSSTSCLPRL